LCAQANRWAQAHLLKAAPEAEQHLVLSAATGGRELRAVVRRFKSRGVARIIFTKLDEADGPAGVLEHSAFKRHFSFTESHPQEWLITDLGRSRLRGSLAAVQMTGIGAGRASIQI
jgi:hypothetical protein